MMKRASHIPRLLKKAAAAAFCLAALAPPAAGQGIRVLDRMVASVDGMIITLSEVEEAQRLAQLGGSRKEGTPGRSRQDALQGLIEQRLIRREIESFPGLEVSDGVIEDQLEALDSARRSDGGLQALADRWGLTLDGIRREISYQLRVRMFMEIRFLSFVTIEEREIERYYREVLPDQLRRGGLQTVPPLESVRQQIHDILVEHRAQDEMNRWLGDLRQKAEITLYEEGLRLAPESRERTTELRSAAPTTGDQSPEEQKP